MNTDALHIQVQNIEKRADEDRQVLREDNSKRDDKIEKHEVEIGELKLMMLELIPKIDELTKTVGVLNAGSGKNKLVQKIVFGAVGAVLAAFMQAITILAFNMDKIKQFFK